MYLKRGPYASKICHNIASVRDSSSYVQVTMGLYIEATQEEYIFTDQRGSVDPIMVGDTAS